MLRQSGLLSAPLCLSPRDPYLQHRLSVTSRGWKQAIATGIFVCWSSASRASYLPQADTSHRWQRIPPADFGIGSMPAYPDDKRRIRGASLLTTWLGSSALIVCPASFGVWVGAYSTQMLTMFLTTLNRAAFAR
ncbi:uncharacterized protein TrAFT101_010568 [Trichoderma asperellum]|uniref:uncharacterized protein n=1 Tax=Trichoderma asperellum TaxID=101201 RepID=UPI00332EAB4F|nr:hypothetical protein TrAFT101_010568 [Trichoderma asperellum]